MQDPKFFAKEPFKYNWEGLPLTPSMSVCGSPKQKIDLSRMPTTNPTPIDVDAMAGGESIRTHVMREYDSQLASQRLFVPSLNALSVPMVTEESVLAKLARVDKEPRFTTAASAPVDALTTLAGEGHPATYVQVFNADTNTLVCGVHRVNTLGKWRCDSAQGLQPRGVTVNYALHSSDRSTGGFTDTGKRVRIQTTADPNPKPTPVPVTDAVTTGRTVTGRTTPGATVQILTQDAHQATATGTGTPLSPVVVAGADGRFTVTANADAPAGIAQLVLTRPGTPTSATRIELAPIPNTTVIIDDRTTGTGDGRWQYAGSWVERNGGTRSNHPGATATLQFTGTAIALDGLKGPDHGIVDITLDGTTTRVDLYQSSPLSPATIFTATGLSNTPHTITITVTGKNHRNATDNHATITQAAITR